MVVIDSEGLTTFRRASANSASTILEFQDFIIFLHSQIEARPDVLSPPFSFRTFSRCILLLSSGENLFAAADADCVLRFSHPPPNFSKPRLQDLLPVLPTALHRNSLHS